MPAFSFFTRLLSYTAFLCLDLHLNWTFGETFTDNDVSKFLVIILLSLSYHPSTLNLPRNNHPFPKSRVHAPTPPQASPSQNSPKPKLMGRHPS